ncbi:UPF0481 protein At3g47200-like [Tasmannia lanceolata]|uniref:UPF0481 protein At3g47200-like n=1 Tax=Tasmannia lanceolata TaxID=3420 RepID=UPI004063C4DE
MDVGNENFWKKRYNYRVPPFVRNLNPKAYDPSFVSFGPYHYGEPQLMPLEEHKVRSVIQLLRISDKPTTDYVNALEEVVEELMDSYDQLDNKWREGDRFLELMFRDGCFLLEFLHKSDDSDYGQYADNDPIFSPHGILKVRNAIFEEALKIENQVPLLVLNKLVAFERGMTRDQSTEYINDLVVKFIGSVLTFVFEVERTDLGSNTCLHVLDLARKYMVGDLISHEPTGSVNIWFGFSATTLNKMANVEFRVSQKNNLGGLAFYEEEGILSLPLFYIFDCTESILLNFAAFENVHAGESHHVSSYVHYICGLIRSVEDCRLMVDQGIIGAGINYDKMVKLMQKLQQDMVFISKFTLFHVNKPSNDYYYKRTRKWEIRLRKWGSNFREKYFDSPWSLFALLAASLLLALAIAQTVYIVLTFYKSG